MAWGASKVATCLGLGEGARAMGCVYGLAAHVAEEVVIRGSADKVAGAVRVAKRLCDGEEVRARRTSPAAAAAAGRRRIASLTG